METLKISEERGVFSISLNQPDTRNAFEPKMISEITDVFQNISGRKDMFAVVLRAEGPSFSAGANLKWMKSMADYSEEDNIKDSQHLFEMFHAMYQCPHPVIGRVHGHVMGGALGLVAVCDMVASVRETKFAFSEVKLGLVPAVISPFVLKKISGSQALEVMLTGENFSEEQAMSWGLINFIGGVEEVDDYVLGKADLLRSAGHEAIRETKRLIRANMGGIDEGLRQLCVKTIAERRVSPEGQEGLSSFFEKRKPRWNN